MKNNYR